MPNWTNDELNKIGTAEELEIAPVREDGTLRKPTTIWVVRVGDDLYVRSYKDEVAPGSAAHRPATKVRSTPEESRKT
jgi:hypothetical protein